MIKGEIYKLKAEFKNKYSPKSYNHHFIYWEEIDGGYRGIMLTTSNKIGFNNIELKKEHIEAGYSFTFGKSKENPISYIAPLYLLKDINYEHLELQGKLSNDGINFISSILFKLKSTDWLTHKKFFKLKAILYFNIFQLIFLHIWT